MFRFLGILAIGILVSGAAFADGNDWGYRSPHHRHRFEQYGYNPYYRAYTPPPVVGYYQAPAEYYGLPPVRGFVYQQQIQTPRCDRNNRRGW